MLKLLKVMPRDEGYADVFIARYERLLVWSLRLTDHDRSMAEDLVQDTFVQFMLNHPDLDTVQNLEGYLYAMLRNTHLSRVRRASQKPQYHLSLVEYDSAEISLKAADVRARLQVQEELWNVCQYACMRKESSKAGSVLILRFFHGYYPSEISKVIQTSRQTVDSWLRLARGEAQLYLEDPNSLLSKKENASLVSDAISRIRSSQSEAEGADAFVAALKTAIFATRQGACLSTKEIRQLYTQTSAASDTARTAIPTENLAHIVSCPVCLDAVNKLLALPLLSDRDPTDSLGPDSRSKGGPDDGPSVRPKRPSLRKYFDRFHQTFEHRPRELRIAVNGYVLASQKIDAELNEQELNLDAEGKVNFIEVFSEQNFRLMLLNVDAPPEGAFEQQLRIALSDDRSIEASLNFGGTWPRLNVTYRDPLIRSELDPQSVIAEEPPLQISPEAGAAAETGLGAFLARGFSSLKQLSRSFLQRNFWLRPATITAGFAFILLAAVLWLSNRAPAPSVSVASLLQQSSAAERALADRTDLVLHRTLDLEERGADGQTIARRKIVVWQSGERGLTARRLYDERGKLLAGIWARNDGVQTFYQHATQPKLQLAPQKRDITALGIDYLWQIPLSAEEFSELIGDTAQAQVEERPESYVLRYARGTQGMQTTSPNSSALVSASLVLGRPDLHAIEQTLVVQIGGEKREYRFSEAGFERRTPASVAPQVFEPEPELLSSPESKTLNSKLETATTATGSQPAVPMMATAALEVEVLQLLSSAGADFSDQVNVTRSQEGRLRIEGVVETAQRKAQLLRALASVSKHPAVQIAIQTVDEAARKDSGSASGPIQLRDVEVLKTELPVEGELRQYFSRRGVPEEKIEELTRSFSERVTHHALQARLHARTIKQTLNRFSADDLRTLDPEAKKKLLALVRGQALNLQREIQALHNELQAIFPPAASRTTAEVALANDVELVRAVGRLSEVVSEADEAVRTSFSLSGTGRNSALVKSPEFWRNVLDAEALNAGVIKFTKE